MDEEIQKNIEIVVKHVERIVKLSCTLGFEEQKEFFKQILDLFSEEFKKETVPFIMKRLSATLIPYISSFVMMHNFS